MFDPRLFYEEVRMRQRRLLDEAARDRVATARARSDRGDHPLVVSLLMSAGAVFLTLSRRTHLHGRLAADGIAAGVSSPETSPDARDVVTVTAAATQQLCQSRAEPHCPPARSDCCA